MFAGPIIVREVVTSPRSPRYYFSRAIFSCFLFVVMWTAWQAIIGWREVREFGLLARFGGVIYNMFAMLQLTLILFFAPLFTAASIAHEKDRRTFILLMMTDLSDLEIVAGKLLAGLLNIMVALAAGAGVLMLCTMLGGISFGQVATLYVVTASSGIAGGAMGLVVALWRDRAFQSIALTIMMVVFSVAGVEAFALAFPTLSFMGVPLAEVLNPYRAVLAALYPPSAETGGVMGTSSLVYIVVRVSFASLLVLFGTRMLRVWNPGRDEPREEREGEQGEVIESLVEINEAEAEAMVAVPVGAGVAMSEAGTSGSGVANVGGGLVQRVGEGSGRAGKDREAGTGLHVPRRTHRRTTRAAKPYRKSWENPVLWRELMTRAYGRRPLIIKGTYYLLFVIGVGIFHSLAKGMDSPFSSSHMLGMIPVTLGILSLILVNAQGVTSLTSERDSGALDLLLVTELSPKEFIYGKLYGVLFNTKEMIVLPILWILYLTMTRVIHPESAVFAVVDFLLLTHFSGMLGIHSAITYTNSRTAVANSLGTIFFLMVGILICAYLIIQSDREFGRQLLSFLIFIGAGSVALFGSLGAKNPSRAIALVALLTPFWSFYCVISMLNGDILAAFLVSFGIYGFALLAMLVPAVSDFDIALGRTSAIQG